ncbi:coat protein [Stevia carlavirus 1]|uniref:Capsid protein n=1 Tax=Stevia carlavirus 1 TaxID=2794421 RepID=A0AAE9P3X3_9VIRU|nr:coat protein [Stevia carlavirus 1]
MPPKEGPSVLPEQQAAAPPPNNEQRAERPQVRSGNADDRIILERLQALTDLLRRERSAVPVTNASFETGRPPLRPTEDMRGDVTNMYNLPSTDLRWSIKPKKVSNNMASSEEMVRIKVALEGLGVPTEEVTSIIIQMCVYCANTSSSEFQDPQGTFEWKGGAIMIDDVIGTVAKLTKLRRVCRLYAPETWNYMHIHRSPPADWAALGFKDETKYAAFDCFDYVQNPAAVQPLGGVTPKPTPAEHVAYQTYKQMALDKAGAERTYANVDASITGGRHGPETIRNHNNANNKRQ